MCYIHTIPHVLRQVLLNRPRNDREQVFKDENWNKDRVELEEILNKDRVELEKILNKDTAVYNLR